MQNRDFFGTKLGHWSRLGPSPEFGTLSERLTNHPVSPHKEILDSPFRTKCFPILCYEQRAERHILKLMKSRGLKCHLEGQSNFGTLLQSPIYHSKALEDTAQLLDHQHLHHQGHQCQTPHRHRRCSRHSH